MWFVSARGGWIEPLVNLPWFALWVGLLLGHYGQWRALGFSRLRALVFVYFLGSLPLVIVHVALAGYADLWIATVFGFAVLAWLRWVQRREKSQLAIAAICALLLPLLKLEGAVWLMLFAGVAAFAALPRRWRRYVAVAVLILLVIGAIFGKLSVPLFGLGWVNISLHSIDVPVIGRLAIAWHGAALNGVLLSLFDQPNWHPAVVAGAAGHHLALAHPCARTAIAAHARLRCCSPPSAFCCSCSCSTVPAARWAESYTAINRLVMHITPAVITLLAMLCRDVRLVPSSSRYRVSV